MPYKTTAELPPAVKDHLPKHAQEIFKEAFNQAFQEYKDEGEEAAFKVAWSAVKMHYEKKGDHWVKKG